MKIGEKIDPFKIGERTFNANETIHLLRTDIAKFWSWADSN